MKVPEACTRCGGELPPRLSILDPVLRGFLCTACADAIRAGALPRDPRVARLPPRLEKAALLAELDQRTPEEWDGLAVDAEAAAQTHREYVRRLEAQQAGNRARRIVSDGWLEDASRRHVAGEPWKIIAADYSISPSRLRDLVRQAGLPTRGHR